MSSYIPYAERKHSKIADLLGLTLSSAVQDKDEEIVFVSVDGRTFVMFHDQDCCESVNIDDVCGHLSDIVGSPILIAEESTSDKRPGDVTNPKCEDDSETWTFYRIGTAKGMVTIRWYGSSNGYYSERVDFVEKVNSEAK